MPVTTNTKDAITLETVFLGGVIGSIVGSFISYIYIKYFAPQINPVVPAAENQGLRNAAAAVRRVEPARPNNNNARPAQPNNNNPRLAQPVYQRPLMQIGIQGNNPNPARIINPEPEQHNQRAHLDLRLFASPLPDDPMYINFAPDIPTAPSPYRVQPTPALAPIKAPQPPTYSSTDSGIARIVANARNKMAEFNATLAADSAAREAKMRIQQVQRQVNYQNALDEINRSARRAKFNKLQ